MTSSFLSLMETQEFEVMALIAKAFRVIDKARTKTQNGITDDHLCNAQAALRSASEGVACDVECELNQNRGDEASDDS